MSTAPAVAPTYAPNRAEPSTSTWREWPDRLLGSDPGLNRLRMALEGVVVVLAILGAEWLFISLTHALEISTNGLSLPAAKATEVALENHELMVVGLLLGAVTGMMSFMMVADLTPKKQLVTMGLVPVAMLAGLALGLAVADERVVSLTTLVLVLALSTYCRRFGARGVALAMTGFMGNFFGYFLGETIKLSGFGWIAAEVAIGGAVAIVVRFVVFSPNHAKALRRTQRSYAARARKVATLALAVFDGPGDSERRSAQLHRHLVRLNETALMIDAQLASPAALGRGSSAFLFHQRLFDAELALTNIARFSQAMVHLDLPAPQRTLVRRALFEVCRGDQEAAARAAQALLDELRQTGSVPSGEDRTMLVVPHRFAGSVIAFCAALSEWLSLGEERGGGGAGPSGGATARAEGFQTPIVLAAGWLPGSAMVSAAASAEAGLGRWEHTRLKPYVRTAIQLGVAAGAAVIVGDALSGRRFYWALIAVFITFMGANNSGEQVRKAIFRVVGTVVGIAIGSGIVDVVGHHTNYSIAVILVFMFIGFYLMRINYAFWVVAITVMVSQLYVQLGEFSNSLLLLRLAETAIGATIAAATVMLVFPLHTRRVLRVAMRTNLQALGNLVTHATERLVEETAGECTVADRSLRTDSRSLDSSHQALLATVQPLRRNLFGAIDEPVAQALRLAGASRNYGRNLVADLAPVGPLDPETRMDVERAGATLQTSIEGLVQALDGPRKGIYVRSSALFDRAERRLEARAGALDPAQLAIRDLKAIDGSMATLASAMGLDVASYDMPAAS